jgi:predicted MPP superfamily phosphohydrolase
LADIHIDTKLDRSLEYQHVFQRLYVKLRQENRNGIIVLVGDILDKKLSLQPECIITTLNFFKELASICPVIVIAGNHDMIEHNPDRVDSLTAILHEKNIPNLQYLKESGVYQYNNCLLGGPE